MSRRNGWRAGAWPYHGESEEDFMKRISAGPKKAAKADRIKNRKRALPEEVRRYLEANYQRRTADGTVIQIR